MNNELISIIITVYNKSLYIKDTIQTVLNQTYNNWEILFVDDCSTDDSVEIIKNNIKSSYKLIELKKNVGAANARNIAIKNAIGRYICFLDADDLWKKQKLENQIRFMQKNNYFFTFTDYEFADISGKGTGKVTNIPSTITYNEALKNTTIFTSTVMIDTKGIKKEDIYMIDVPYEDTATWWNILKKYHIAYGFKEVLSLYRRGHVSLSSNKLISIKRIWNLYRNVENLSILKSTYCFVFYAINAFIRRI